eukprot:7353379-Pyramimonas_sp.AAC.1
MNRNVSTDLRIYFLEWGWGLYQKAAATHPAALALHRAEVERAASEWGNSSLGASDSRSALSHRHP